MTAESERAAIVAWLRDAIERGYPARADTNGRCPHDVFVINDDCIACYDDHLYAALEAVERGEHIKDTDND